MSSLPLYFCFLVFLVFSLWLFFFKFKIFFVFFLFLFFVIFFFWFFMIFKESFLGFHNFLVMEGLKFGFFLFLMTEFMFFFSIFWFFFDISLVLGMDLGFYWAPLGLVLINPFGVPFLNTLLLLSSAIFLTDFHNKFLLEGFSLLSLFFVLILGFLFLLVQLEEYKSSFFNFGDSVFGSIFFFSTGFHGFHVFLGFFFLLVNFFLIFKKNMNFFHHLGLEFSIIYWHFVDVVWLFLYFFVYWWVFWLNILI